MKIKKILSTLLISLAFLCSYSDSMAMDNSDNLVTFKIHIDKKNISNKGYLKVRILNEKQISINENSVNCMVSFDLETKKETVTCPQGKKYKKLVPEIFTFKISEIKDHILIKSHSVKIGKKYSLNISGLSPDNCNTASASIAKTADSTQQNIKNLQWIRTLRACST